MNPLVDEALKLLKESETARQAAIASLIGEQQDIADQLEALGHVVDGVNPARRPSAAVKPDRICQVCEQKGHDGRFHRGDNKKTAVAAPNPPATAGSK